MSRRSCDGAGLLDAFRASVETLESHVDEINALNVYPVPDGDTGNNMLATVRAALDEAEGVTDTSAHRVAAALSFGALMGARGNSGVILSQVFRGMAEALEGKRRFNGPDVAHALTVGSTTAYAAVVKPVEGTILTVAREAAAAAVVAAEEDADLEAVVTAAVDAAGKAVERTPSLLPILREAGVVDAGGEGLYRILQGALRHLVAEHPHARATAQAPGSAKPSALVAHADAGYGYETMFLLQPRAGALDVDAIRHHLESIGESVLVAGDPRAVKVHVHSARPDEVIAYGLGAGTLTRISIENLDQVTRDIREHRTGHRARTGPAAGDGREGRDGRDGHAEDGTTEAAPVERPDGIAGGDGQGHLSLAVVAVAAGPGLGAIFSSFGVAAVVEGGQADNPSTGELLAAVDALDADEVLILPNNPNVVLAARQVAAMARRPVQVVATRNAAEGFAALLALDPGRGAAPNVAAMTAAGRAVQSLQVTEAIRDASIGGRKVKKGQTIVLDPDDGLVAADGDRLKAVLRAVESLAPGFELLTIYYGDGADLAEAEALAHRLTGWREGLEVEVVHGGQPHYRYLLAAE